MFPPRLITINLGLFFFIIFITSSLLFGKHSSPFPIQEKNLLKDSISNFNTDTIKARLISLNKKTPINISYTPELEDLIKKYLKDNFSYKKMTDLEKMDFNDFLKLYHTLPLINSEKALDFIENN